MNLFGSVSLIDQTTKPAVLIPAQIWWLADVAVWRFVRQWKRNPAPSPVPAARDSLEYAALAGKRWRFLMQQKLSVAGWADLRRHLSRDPAAELGMALAITHSVGNKTAVLGFGFVRRTWANNLVLEFLAISPLALARIRGTGAAIMYSLASIACWLSCSELWGECTRVSRGFYSKLIRKHSGRGTAREARGVEPEQITDRFQFTRSDLRRLAASSSVEIQPCPPTPLKPSFQP